MTSNPLHSLPVKSTLKYSGRLSFNIFYTIPATQEGKPSAKLECGIIEVWLCHQEQRKYTSLLRDSPLYIAQSGISLALGLESDELYFPLREKRLVWLPGGVLKASFAYRNRAANRGVHEIAVCLRCSVLGSEYSVANFVVMNKYSPHFIGGACNMVYPVQKLNIKYNRLLVESVALIVYGEHSIMGLEKMLRCQRMGIIKLHGYYGRYAHTEDIVARFLPGVMNDSIDSRFVYINLLRPNIVSNRVEYDKRKTFYSAEYRNESDVYSLQKVIYKQQKYLKVCNSLYVICFSRKSLGIPKIMNSTHFLFLKGDLKESLDELLNIFRCENCVFRETNISNIVFNNGLIGYNNIIKVYCDQPFIFKFNIAYLKLPSRTNRSSTISNPHTERSSVISNSGSIIPYPPRKQRVSRTTPLNRLVTEYYQWTVVLNSFSNSLPYALIQSLSMSFMYTFTSLALVSCISY